MYELILTDFHCYESYISRIGLDIENHFQIENVSYSKGLL